jgi:hypothetical protein
MMKIFIYVILSLVIILVTLIFVVGFSLGIGTSDGYRINQVISAISEPKKQALLLQWVDNLFPDQDSANICAPARDEIDMKPKRAGDKIQKHPYFDWESYSFYHGSNAGITPAEEYNEIRLLKSTLTQHYYAVYFGNNRLGVIVILSFVDKEKYNKLIFDEYVSWRRGRILVTHGPLFVSR